MTKIFEKIIAFIIGFIVVVTLTALPVMLLWNVLMPELFGLKTIDFWQALALSCLCSLLFQNSKSSDK